MDCIDRWIRKFEVRLPALSSTLLLESRADRPGTFRSILTNASRKGNFLPDRDRLHPMLPQSISHHRESDQKRVSAKEEAYPSEFHLHCDQGLRQDQNENHPPGMS